MTLSKSLDTAIAAVAPQWACRRAAARNQLDIMAAGGRLTSESNPNNAAMDSERHPDNDTIPDSQPQRRRCTLAYYNNAVVNGVVESQVRRIIGSLTVQAESGDTTTDTAIESEWYRRLDAGLHEGLKLGARHLLIDGGFAPHCLGAFSDPLDFEIIPYRLIRQPTDRTPIPTALTDGPGSFVRDGFKYVNGKQVAFFVEHELTTWNNVAKTAQFYELPMLSHPCLSRLAGQSRGLSWYSAAITRLDFINRWTLALLTSAELHAYMVALCVSPGRDAKGMATMGDTSLDSATSQRIMTYARQHRMLFIPNGADFKLIQANAPTVADFITTQFRIVARQLGVSYERLTYDLTHTSFSSTKFGDRDDKITTADHQDIFIRTMLIPLHKRLVAGMALRGELPNSGAYSANKEVFERVRFTLPGCPPVDEAKAETANQTALMNRTSSRTRMAANRGDDAEEIALEIVREDSHFFELRKAFWMEKGYDEDYARDMARDEIRDPRQELFPKAAEPKPESSASAGQDEEDDAPASRKEEQAA